MELCLEIDMRAGYGWNQRLFYTGMDEVVVLVEQYGCYESQFQTIQSIL
jgi:hypothetical protein